MRILALIPARGGSKRLPGKNIRVLGERPLLAWSIDVAKGIPEICDILVSTDDSTIADVARKEGALIPWLRPAELATDTAPTVDVCLHALSWYEGENGNIDGLLLLQPTSPFRIRDTLLRGIDLFRTNNYRAVLGVSPAKSHPMRCFRIEGETLHPFIRDADPHLRHQDLPPAYSVNGAFYLITPAELRKARTFFTENMQPLLMNSPQDSVDIDTEWDWLLAEAILGSQDATSSEK